MPDLEQRLELEGEIQQALGPLFDRQAREVAAARAERRAPEWENWAALVAAGLLPAIAAGYEQAGVNLAQQLGLPAIDRGLQAGAASWARQRAVEVAGGIVDTSRQRLTQADLAAIEDTERRRRQREREGLPLTGDELDRINAAAFDERLSTVFGAERVEMIGATEVTGAITAGEEDTNDFVWAALGVAGLLVLAGGAAVAAGAVIDAASDAMKAAERGVEVLDNQMKRRGDRVRRSTERRETRRETAERFGSDTLTQAGEELNRQNRTGRVPVKVWVTEADARVCPICAPLHRQPQSRWWAILRANGYGRVALLVARQGGPSAHPRCRCWTEIVWAVMAEAA